MLSHLPKIFCTNGHCLQPAVYLIGMFKYVFLLLSRSNVVPVATVLRSKEFVILSKTVMTEQMKMYRCVQIELQVATLASTGAAGTTTGLMILIGYGPMPLALLVQV